MQILKDLFAAAAMMAMASAVVFAILILIFWLGWPGLAISVAAVAAGAWLANKI